MSSIEPTDTLEAGNPTAKKDCTAAATPSGVHTLSEMAAVETKRKTKAARLSSVHHVRFEVIRLDCAPPTASCPRCHREARRCDKVERGPIVDASMEGPIFLFVEQGVYCCKECLIGAGSSRPLSRYFRFKLPFTIPRGRYTLRARRLGIDGVKLDGMPFTKVVKRLAREFFLKPARSTVWRWHAEEGDTATAEMDYRPWARESLSGVLCIDELYDGDFCLLSATDPLAQVTVGFQLVDKKSVDAEQMSKFFEYLETIGAKPEVVISDESKLYPAALSKTWPEVLHQLCEFHFIRHLVNDVIASVRAYVQSMPKNPKRRRGRPCKRGRPRVDHDEKRGEVHRKRFMVSMNPDNMSPDEKKTLDDLLVEHPTLAIPREFMLKSYRMFDPAGDLAAAQALRQEILKDPRFQADAHLCASLNRLRDDERFAKLTQFLAYENLNRTNNDVERDNRRFRKKQKSHYRLRINRTIRNALNLKMQIEREELLTRKTGVPKLRSRPKAALAC